MSEKKHAQWAIALTALRNIAIAPCLFELLGEKPEEPCACPGCAARGALTAIAQLGENIEKEVT